MIQGTYKEHTRNIQGTYKEHTRNIQGTYKDHTRNILTTYKEHTRNIQGTYKEHTNNIQGTYKEHTGCPFNCHLVHFFFYNRYSQNGHLPLECIIWLWYKNYQQPSAEYLVRFS